MEKEIDHKMPFFEVFINDTHFPVTSVYRKKTFTSRLTNYFSFTSLSYKLGLIRTFVDRTYQINNTWLSFHDDITKHIKIPQMNLFTVHLVENMASVSDTARTFYFKLPYIFFSIITQIRHFAKRYCNNIDIKSVFLSFEIVNMFSVKDPILLWAPCGCGLQVFVCGL